MNMLTQFVDVAVFVKEQTESNG